MPPTANNRSEGFKKLATSLRRVLEEPSGPLDMEQVALALGGTVTRVGPEESEHEATIKPNGASFEIRLRDGVPRTRERFTIAHEIGHLFLHMNFLEKDKWGKLTKRFEEHRFGNSREEYEAHSFACELLMPEEEFRTIFDENNGNLSRIADYFGVSRLTTETRARWLRLIER